MKSISKTYVTPVSGSRFQGFYLFVCLAKYIVPKEILRPWGLFQPCDCDRKGHECVCGISSSLLESFSYYQIRFVVGLEIVVGNASEHLRYS